jgi:uncharacterized protein DUF5362
MYSNFELEINMKILFFPFIAIWKLLEFILKLTGRLMAVILGLVFMIVGAILCCTVIGAVVGIPIIIFGFTLMLRGFFK